jgi:cyanophycin synthetase
MEEHLVGSVYRGTLVDGKLVAVLRGDPPRVTGDGSHTIAQLVEIENAKHADKVSPIVVTPEYVDFLMRNGYKLETILPAGLRIDVLSKVGISYGGMSAEMTPHIHPKVREYLNKAGSIVVYPVVGFDFIIEDVTLDPDTQRWGIIEANSTPFVQLHHFPVQGEPVDVASAVWNVVEKSGQI